MKKLLFSLTALVCSTALFAQTTDVKAAPAASGKKAADVAKFETETVNLGKLKKDNPSTAVFTVTNISNEPLIIEQANPTCGCTISDYTKEPIAPGKTGTIKATYNAKNPGAFEKHLTVKFAGVDEIKSITLKGEVTQDEAAAVATPATTTPIKAAPAATPTETKATPATKTAGKRTTTTKKVAPATTAPKS